MTPALEIGGRKIGLGYPVYVVAEMSANHGQDFDRAVEIIRAAKEAGADAVKIQTYTPETMTIACDNEYFRIKGTVWAGKTLYDLYGEAFTPWEWQPHLKTAANELGLDFFSTPFDESAVEFLEAMNVPVYKIASFENVDIPLLTKVAGTGKPIIMSTGMATLGEIDEAVSAIRQAGGNELALLKCTSPYPAPPEEMSLRTIPHLADAFNVVAGLSDHTLDLAVPVAAVALGACIIEKHFTLSRSEPGPDAPFSLEPDEFREMVQAVRKAGKALGSVRYGLTPAEITSKVFRRSIFVVEDVLAGEPLTKNNIRVIRPGHGLHSRHLKDVLGRPVIRDVKRGTPLAWDLIGPNTDGLPSH